jgi:hypothetical protein
MSTGESKSLIFIRAPIYDAGVKAWWPRRRRALTV